MAEPFKNLLNTDLVALTGQHLSRVWPPFKERAFVALATTGLDDMEMKARAMHIASALQATLPIDFTQAASIVEAALAPPFQTEDLSAMRITKAGLAGWILWSVGEWVVRSGMGTPQRALPCLHAITQRFSAEFALRPFIAEHPALARATLAKWAQDSNVHVRRLASEGSRPRLPWGMRLQALVADPSPSLPLLQSLQDDTSAYVRRSVANHLNDIAKDHPSVVAAWLHQHLPGASTERKALLRHASRTLIKQGHPETLQAWGLGAGLQGEARLRVTPQRLTLGASLTLEVSLVSSSSQTQTLVIDYAVHHVKADGSTHAKVFKGWNLSLPPRGELRLSRQHSMRVITTRRYYAGRHRVVVLVNGQAVAEAAFVLRLPVAN